MLETLGLDWDEAWGLTRFQGQAGSLIQAHLGHAVCRLHVGQKLVVLGWGRCHLEQACTRGPTPSTSPTSWEGQACLRHLLPASVSLPHPPPPRKL